MPHEFFILRLLNLSRNMIYLRIISFRLLKWVLLEKLALWIIHACWRRKFKGSVTQVLKWHGKINLPMLPHPTIKKLSVSILDPGIYKVFGEPQKNFPNEFCECSELSEPWRRQSLPGGRRNITSAWLTMSQREEDWKGETDDVKCDNTFMSIKVIDHTTREAGFRYQLEHISIEQSLPEQIGWIMVGVMKIPKRALKFILWSKSQHSLQSLHALVEQLAYELTLTFMLSLLHASSLTE